MGSSVKAAGRQTILNEATNPPLLFAHMSIRMSMHMPMHVSMHTCIHTSVHMSVRQALKSQIANGPKFVAKLQAFDLESVSPDALVKLEA